MQQFLQCSLCRTIAIRRIAGLRPVLLMMLWIGIGTGLATDLVTGLACQEASAQEPTSQTHPIGLPTVHARLATGPINIDGKLNEPDWQMAEPMMLTQQSPHPGQATPYRTDVRVLIYHDAL